MRHWKIRDPLSPVAAAMDPRRRYSGAAPNGPPSVLSGDRPPAATKQGGHSCARLSQKGLVGGTPKAGRAEKA
eukprot:7619249-Heterocapsa_arctica.AAC.1